MYSCPLIISCWPSARAMQSHTPPDAKRVQRSAPYNYGYLTEAFIFNYHTDLPDRLIIYSALLPLSGFTYSTQHKGTQLTSG